MKTKALVCGVMFIGVVLAGVVSFAADKKTYNFSLPVTFEEIYGTWVNEEYSGFNLSGAQKLVYYNWGYSEVYYKVADEIPSDKCTFILVEKWTDPEGNVWYKEYDQATHGKGFYLDKISKNGTVLETVWLTHDFPSEKDLTPANHLYRIYYRQ